MSSQRKILTDFADHNGFVVVDEYIDDGYSGANFKRPAFTKLLEDAQSGRINAVIVKDLSRLGRDYIGTGQYMEKIFPRLGVRFIAIADGYDGLDDENPSADMMPMINFFNEYHSKQNVDGGGVHARAHHHRTDMAGGAEKVRRPQAVRQPRRCSDVRGTGPAAPTAATL